MDLSDWRFVWLILATIPLVASLQLKPQISVYRSENCSQFNDLFNPQDHIVDLTLVCNDLGFSFVVRKLVNQATQALTDYVDCCPTCYSLWGF